MPRDTTDPSEEDESFGAQMIRYRKARKMSRKDCADYLRSKGFEISQLSILRWEKHRRLPQNPELYHWLVTEFKRLKL